MWKPFSTENNNTTMSETQKIQTDKEFMAAADDVVVLANAIARKTAKMEKELQDLRGEYEPEIDSLEATKTAKKQSMIAYLKRKGVADRIFRAGQRQGESYKAIFGFRKNPPTVKTFNTKAKLSEVAAALFARDETKYLRIPEPPPPVINSQAVLDAKLTVGELAALGLRITQPETFYCESKDAKPSQK